MKRLEFSIKTRTSHGPSKNPAEAALALAHASRERTRLSQERAALEKRLRRIDSRLKEISENETTLVPLLQQLYAKRAAEAVDVLPRRSLLPPGAAAATLQY